MTTINAVTVLPKHLELSLRILPEPCSSAWLLTCPGNLCAGYWDRAGRLSLFLPLDGAEREMACTNVDEAARQAELVWNTPAGRARVERRITKNGGVSFIDWDCFKTCVAVKNVIDSVCGNGAPIERVTEAAFGAAFTKLAEVHGEHAAYRIAKQWYERMSPDASAGYFGPPH